MNLTTNHHIIPFFFIALLGFSGNALSHHDCDKYSKKITKLKKQMRQSYTVKKGEKLKDLLSKTQDLRFTCENTMHKLSKLKARKKKIRKHKENQRKKES